jgi:GR25 family glycosyltransferase involved in LPS biosynthesis
VFEFTEKSLKVQLMSTFTPQIYILGVKDRYRGLNLETHLRDENVSFKSMWGIDARVEGNSKVLEVLADQDLAKAYLGKELLLGEIACAELHQRTYKDFFENGAEWAVIFEDDIGELLLPISDLAGLFTELSSDPTIVKFDVSPKQFRKYIRSTTLEKKGFSLQEDFSLVTLARVYGINRQAARTIVSTMKDQLIINQSDWPIQWRYKVRALSVSPSIAVDNHNQTSVIEETAGPGGYLLDSKGAIAMMKRRRLFCILSGYLVVKFLKSGLNPRPLYQQIFREFVRRFYGRQRLSSSNQ